MKRRPRGFWCNFDNLCNSAKGYTTFREWGISNQGGLDFTNSYPKIKKKFIQKCFSGPFQTRKSWDYEKLKIEAKKYSSIVDWYKKNKGTLNYFYKAKKNGVITKKQSNEICKHMNKLGGKKRTFKECLNSALKCKSKTEWRLKDYNTYKFALNRPRWFKKCTKHMPIVSSLNSTEVNIEQPKFVKMFNEVVSEYTAVVFNKCNMEKVGLKFDSYRKAPDCVIFNKNKTLIYFIEIKTDKSHFSCKKIIQQLKEYDKLGRRNFKDKFKGTLLCFPLGIRKRKNIKVANFKQTINFFNLLN